jgi:hypothetical protein
VVGCLEYALYWAQHLRQRFRAELGCSTRATRQAGQPDLLSGGLGFVLDHDDWFSFEAYRCGYPWLQEER